MGRPFAIAGFVLLLVSLPIPIYGNFISLLALALIGIAAFQGEKTWTLTTDILAWVKILFLSPTWKLAMWGHRSSMGGLREFTNQTNQSLGIRDPALDNFMVNAQRVDTVPPNVGLILLTFGLLLAPLVIVALKRNGATLPSPAPVEGDEAV